MTYPQPKVQATIEADFAPFKVNMMERHPDFKEACAGGRVMWGPTFIVADARGGEIRRWVGWLPENSFVAELDLCRALAQYNRGDFESAKSQFDQLVERTSGIEIHAEAIYWQGISGFMAGKQDWEALGQSWRRLAEEYPQSRFGTHASVIADA